MVSCSFFRLFMPVAVIAAVVMLAIVFLEEGFLGAGAANRGGGQTSEQARKWVREWPRTDFSKHAVDLGEIFSGGPLKDGIPAIDLPRFTAVDKVRGLGRDEPVISLAVGGEMRAYPLSVLIWHEIVNDTVGGVPVTVTFCPLCNSSIVFDRRLSFGGRERVLDFGTTGKLRRSDMVMYDRQTESWWQQFLGEAIIGELTGAELTMLPSRVESFARFRQRAKQAGKEGRVLVPGNPDLRSYGRNPYAGYDSGRPFLYAGKMPDGIAPLARVVVVGKEAWSLDLLRKRGAFDAGDLVFTWTPGQNSALDNARIARGRDVGNVTVQRRTGEGLEDVVYDVNFAFAFTAFHPKGVMHLE
tara:strand:- start:850 stop:1917 length:1068 start_codon:yes stop_codon:yes gene_type:complete